MCLVFGVFRVRCVSCLVCLVFGVSRVRCVSCSVCLMFGVYHVWCVSCSVCLVLLCRSVKNLPKRLLVLPQETVQTPCGGSTIFPL